jgi:hypothetical protein
MSLVLIYIATNFLAPISCISPRIVDFSFQLPPKLTNISTRISQKSPSRKKLASDRLKPALFHRSTTPTPAHSLRSALAFCSARPDPRQARTSRVARRRRPSHAITHRRPTRTTSAQLLFASALPTSPLCQRQHLRPPPRSHPTSRATSSRSGPALCAHNSPARLQLLSA